jgi:hypothetical protein
MSGESATIREYRSAARIIIAAPKPRHEKLQALMRLAKRARESEAGVLSQQAVWVESKRFIRQERLPRPVSSNDPADRAIRTLIRRGYHRCPSCARGLPDERTLDKLRGDQLAELERRKRFEEAGS